jgi:hypothetical protein
MRVPYVMKVDSRKWRMFSVFVAFFNSFPGVKWPGREADHSPPTSAEVKKMWIYTSTPPYAFMA